jgi:hypothetical protein
MRDIVVPRGHILDRINKINRRKNMSIHACPAERRVILSKKIAELYGEIRL